jgi:hypothetical protein
MTLPHFRNRGGSLHTIEGCSVIRDSDIDAWWRLFFFRILRPAASIRIGPPLRRTCAFAILWLLIDYVRTQEESSHQRSLTIALSYMCLLSSLNG